MRILKVKVKNFGSYANLEFDYSNPGLTLVCGPTGAGKSTLLDLPCWVLYGETAKQGAVNDVISWTAEDASTEGTLEVETSNGTIIVTRIRGRSNDLFWTEQNDTQPKRGKDYNDTQLALDARLGCDFASFLSGCYFSELSGVANFFLAKAKDRREIIAQVVDVSFCDKLAEVITAKRRLLAKDLASYSGKIGRLEGEVLGSNQAICNLEKLIKASDEESAQRVEQQRKATLLSISKLEAQIDNYYDDPSEIEERISISERAIAENNSIICSGCGGPGNYRKAEYLQNQLASYKKHLYRLKAVEANNAALLHRVNDLKKSMKLMVVFPEDKAALSEEIKARHLKIGGIADNIIKFKHEALKIEQTISSLEHLIELTQTLRTRQVESLVGRLEEQTNEYLAQKFESEFQVSFSLNSVDKLDVTIQKNGYECSYRQLSKGQRQLLKICFVLSIMEAVQDKNGVHFDNLFFDEPLDGCDTALRLKAFSLFEGLINGHSSVMVIDHSQELQQYATQRIRVELVDDESRITDGA